MDHNPFLCSPKCWPAADRAAWDLNFTPGDPFDDVRRGADLSLGSKDKIARGYSRWLGFLKVRGWFDPDQPPLERVSIPRLQAYAKELRRRGNADLTIISRFSELRTALQILVPGADVDWVVRPFGPTIYSMLKRVRRPKRVPESDVLYQWAFETMDGARADGGPSTRALAVDFRDGLLIAMLACRARRLRSMTLLRIGHELVWRGNRFHLELTADQVKTRKHDSIDLPDQLTPYIRHYLERVRPILLSGRVSEALWITRNGAQMTEKGIANQVSKRTKARFGYIVGPHAFRHALATTAVLRDPGHPTLAAEILGISADIVEKHYNRAGQVQAVQRLGDLLERRRRELRTSNL